MDVVIFSWIGAVVAIALAAYLLLGISYWLLDVEVDPAIPAGSMPALKPVPIPTKKQRSWLHKLVVFVFAVRRWELVENWRYPLDEEGGVEVIIPKGFRFDGASIPRVFWAFLSPTGLLLIPGLLHDYGYKHQQLWRIREDGRVEAYRAGADKDYWDGLFKRVGDEVNGVFLVNVIAWLAVAVGGNGAWERHRSAGVPATRPVPGDDPG